MYCKKIQQHILSCSIFFFAFIGVCFLACQSSTLQLCGDYICPEGRVCAPGKSQCILRSQLVNCEGRIENEECSYLGDQKGLCLGGVCSPSGCGNLLLDENEVCDDGNRLHGDGCSADCLSDESCGNGIIDQVVGESCDDDGPQCKSSTCTTAHCGDGTIDNFESCDDGEANSNLPNDSCRTNCQRKRCGDGITDLGELCDDGNVLSGDGCSANCLSNETCGNEIVDATVGEQCDEVSDTCRATCKIVRCGDGIVDSVFFENCDEGDDNSNDPDSNCRLNCRSRRCGDGIVDVASKEQCDDGNLLPGDECSGQCLFEQCGNGVIDFALSDDGISYVPTEECDDSNILSKDGCSMKCAKETLQWTLLELASAPSPGPTSVMAYDAERNILVFYNGIDIWEWDTTTWRKIKSVTSGPGVRYDAAMAYDPANKEMVLFGGSRSNLSDSFLNDTWVWDGLGWSQRSPATRPGVRRGPSLVYDPNSSALLLFGGRSSFFQLRNDTWVWDGSNWTEILSSASPSPRWGGAMAYDAIANVTILFGGFSIFGGPLSDTRIWNGVTWSSRISALTSIRQS